MINLKDEYIGRTFNPLNKDDFKENIKTINNTPFEIVNYESNKKVEIKFLDENEYTYITRLDHILENNVKNPFQKTILDVGCLGLYKEHSHLIMENGKHSKCYDTWRDMLVRCYDKKSLKKLPTYIDCKVSDEWLNYDNFAFWFDKNYYTVENETMCLDKDIIVKHNKIYNSDNCCFVPDRINKLFIRNEKFRGDCVIGVKYVKKYDCYQAGLNILGKQKTKFFKDEITAFKWYKEEKEALIKKVADEYKDKIPNILYESLLSYRVEMDD